MKLSYMIQRLEQIKEREGDIDIQYIVSEERPDDVVIGKNDTLEFYQLPF